MRVFRLFLVLLVGGLVCGGSCHWHDDDDDCHHHDGYWHCHDDDDHYDHHAHHAQAIVLLTDRQEPRFRSLKVTVTQAVLLDGNGQPHTVYQNTTGRRVDLLSLKGTKKSRLYELLAVGDVPARVYPGLRLTLKDPELVLESGEVVRGDAVDLAAGGRVELELAPPLMVSPDEPATLVLDYRLERSVERLDGADAEKARWRIRPVIDAAPAEDMVTDVHTPLEIRGQVAKRDSKGAICTVKLEGGRGEIKVSVHDDTAVLDGELQPFVWEAVAVGAPVSVRGYLSALGNIEATTLVTAATKRRVGVVEEWSGESGGSARFTLRSGGKTREISVDPEATRVTYSRLTEARSAELNPPKGARVAVTVLRDLPEQAVWVDFLGTEVTGVATSVRAESESESESGALRVRTVSGTQKDFRWDSASWRAGVDSLRVGARVAVRSWPRETRHVGGLEVLADSDRVQGELVAIGKEAMIVDAVGVDPSLSKRRRVRVAPETRWLFVEEADGYLVETQGLALDAEIGMRADVEIDAKTGVARFVVLER